MGTTASVFPKNKRIRLGIWGLGRGMHFYRACAALNIDVVAGCDFNQHMRERFANDVPGALVTADAEEFLAADFDAVLLATFCTAHAPDAIRCLAAGKHVLSEVTAFHTPAEGVRLVEAVERSGKVYNLAENYPFSAANMWLAEKWRDGLFGELMYAEFEYVHELRQLCYTYIDGKPVQPGDALHSWRSWLDYHFYCTHSLGPIMVITGARPTRVVALAGRQTLPGYPVQPGLGQGLGQVAPSLITMDNGGVVRNLMGGTTSDTHTQRLWGTRGAAFQGVGPGLQLRLGGSGSSPMHEVTPKWPALGEQAAASGHGGGDFWVLYYFARQIHTGERAPWDVYSAADVTLPGILAYRSAKEDGKPYDVPDFRVRAQRDAWRSDDGAQPHLDPRTHLFGRDTGSPEVAGFNATIASLIELSQLYRAWSAWDAVAAEMVAPAEAAAAGELLLPRLAELRATYRDARRIVDAFPKSQGARALRELLDASGESVATKPAFAAKLKKRIAELRKPKRASARG
jgi:hypothetical protein